MAAAACQLASLLRNGGREGTAAGQRKHIVVRCQQEERDSSSAPAAPSPSAPTNPSTRRFTGYVAKDTAGQENIYSVEPNVYVADSAFSTNSDSTSGEGSAGTLAIAGFLALATVGAAAGTLFTLSKGSSPTQLYPEDSYSGPSLSYYASKFENSGEVAPKFESQDAPSLVAEGN